MSEIDYTKWEYPETDLEVIEEFDGYIDQITDDGFWLFFHDMSDEELQMEMDMAFIDEEYPEEKPWLQEGAYFRWQFFKDTDEDGAALNEFIIYKRTWSKEDKERAEAWAEEMSKALNWEKPDKPL